MNELLAFPHPSPLPQVGEGAPDPIASPHASGEMASVRGRRQSQRGFSLLEVLVAFVILALVGSVLSRLYSSSLRNAGAAEEWSRAELVAEGRLEVAASVVPLRPGTASGSEDDGRISWTTRIEPYVAPDVSPDLLNASAQLPLQLLRVSVDVSFPGATGLARDITLSTIKLTRKDLQ